MVLLFRAICFLSHVSVIDSYLFHLFRYPTRYTENQMVPVKGYTQAKCDERKVCLLFFFTLFTKVRYFLIPSKEQVSIDWISVPQACYENSQITACSSTLFPPKKVLVPYASFEKHPKGKIYRL